MNFIFDTIRKLLVLTLCITFVTAFVYVPQEYGEHHTVPTAEAAWPVVDIKNIAANVKTAINKTITKIKDVTLDAILWALAKSLISNIMQSTIQWINNGFQGSPAFIRDFDRFLLGVADEAAGRILDDVLQGTGLEFICDPFRLNIGIALALQYEIGRQQLPYQGCLLSETFENFEEFIAGNFSQGGFPDFVTIIAQPGQYTEFGAMITAQTNFNQRLLAVDDRERSLLSFGDGFLSSKSCEFVSVPTPEGGLRQEEQCTIETPGQVISKQLNETLQLGNRSLIEADEINELIGALVGQLSVQALRGTAGLLGLSQNTGFNYQGFNAGSFIGALDLENRDQQRSSFTTLRQDMEDVLAVQESFRAVAVDYNGQARTIQATNAALVRDPEVDENAQQVIDETAEIIDQLDQDIPFIRGTIRRYDALEAEYPTATPVRQDEIIAEQRDIVLGVTQGNYYQEGEILLAESEWDELLSLNDEIPPEIDPDD